MTESNGHAPAPPPEAERGRYAAVLMPDGALMIYRAGDLCEDCLNHGCGTQLAPLGPIPANFVEPLKLAGQGDLPGAVKLLMSASLPLPGMKRVAERRVRRG